MKKAVRFLTTFVIVYALLTYIGLVKIETEHFWLYNLKIYWVNKALVAVVLALLVEIVSTCINRR